MSRRTMIEDIIDQFKTKFTLANGYKVEPKIHSGIVDISKINTDRASLNIAVVSDPIRSHHSDNQISRDMRITFIGYINNALDLYDFSEELESFLYSNDFSYDVLLDDAGPEFEYEGILGIVNLNRFGLIANIIYQQDLRR